MKHVILSLERCKDDRNIWNMTQVRRRTGSRCGHCSYGGSVKYLMCY